MWHGTTTFALFRRRSGGAELTRAAQRLNTAQPSLSQQIQDLEQVLSFAQ
jgi:DNA-binding transcriptional LysR family regulator